MISEDGYVRGVYFASRTVEDRTLPTDATKLLVLTEVTPLECRGNYSATSKNMKLVYYILTVVGSAQARPRSTKRNSRPVSVQRIAA